MRPSLLLVLVAVGCARPGQQPTAVAIQTSGLEARIRATSPAETADAEETAEPTEADSTTKTAANTEERGNAQPPPQAGSCSILGRVAAVSSGPEEFTIARADYERAVENIQATLGSGFYERLVPGHSTTNETGLHLFGVRQDATCGFQNADLILRLNGASVVDDNAFVGKAASWSSLSQLVVELERKEESEEAWKPLRFTYQIVD